MTSALLLLVVAAGGDWDASFESTTLVTYLDGPAPAVLVASADKSPETLAATDSLIRSLRGSQRTRLVMEATSLGDLTGLGDTEIAQKSAGLPVDTVCVVRVFDGAETKTAVVSFLGTNGKLRTAFSTPKGTPPTTREGGALGGVSESTLGAVTKEVERAKADTSPTSEFDAKHLEWMDAYAQNGQLVWSRVFQGNRRRPVSELELYRLVGRPDLAEAYAKIQTRRIGLMLGGGAIAVAGGILVAVTMSQAFGCAEYSGTPTYPGLCLRRNSPAPVIAAGALTAAGLVVFYVGLLSNPHPVPIDEARQLLLDYNAKLKKVGLLDVGVDVVATRDGASLVLRGAF